MVERTAAHLKDGHCPPSEHVFEAARVLRPLPCLECPAASGHDDDAWVAERSEPHEPG